MKTVELHRFNSHMIQLGLSFCIPASAHAIFQYHDSSFPHSQEYILSLMVVGESNHQPSFRAMVKHVLPVVQDQFTLTNLLPSTFQEWTDNIKKEIDNLCPIAIATRVLPSGVHIRVVLGYDDNTKLFMVFNPGVSTFASNILNGIVQPGLVL